MKQYCTKLTLNDKHYEVTILPNKSDGFDLEVVTKGSICGEEFQVLRKYLIEEGYIDAAKEFTK